MPRKPNYNFERAERARIKAAKKAERLQAKADRAAAKKTETEGEQPEAGEPADTAAAGAGPDTPQRQE